jgi:DNA-binding CsgD family transcriptional regulator
MYEESPRARALARALCAAAEAVHLSELGDGALGALQHAVSASGTLLYRYDADGRLEPLAGNLAGQLSTYACELREADPLQRAPHAMAPGAKVVHVTHEVDPGEYHASPAYHEFYRPHELEHIVCTWLTDRTLYGAPGMVGLLLARSSRASDFSAEDVRLLEHALPALTAATRRINRAESDARTRRSLDALLSASVARPLLALDATGRPLWMAAPAEALLASVLGRQGKLPDVLTSAARRLAALALGRDVVAPPPFSVRVPLPDGRTLQAELSLARGAGGEPLVRVELAEPAAAPKPTTFSEFGARHSLTRAEVEVLKALGRGLSNGEIAEQLFVSVETVRTHVRRILAKLEVPSRVRAALLVRDLVN